MSSRSKVRRARRAAAAALAILLPAVAVPGSAGAQSPEDARSAGFEVSGYIGALMPLARLADSGDTITAEFSTKLAFGGEVDYWLGNGFGIGATAGYSNPELTLQIVQEDSNFPLSVPLGRVDYWTLAGHVMWRPELGGSAAVVRPYLGIGAGVASLSYPASDDFAPIADETRFAGLLMGGAHVEITGSWFARLDLRDTISEFSTEPFPESKMQHDLVIAVFIGYSFL